MKSIWLVAFLTFSCHSVYGFNINLHLENTSIVDLSLNWAKNNTLHANGESAEFTYSSLVFNVSVYAINFPGVVDKRIAAGVGLFNMMQIQLGASSEKQNFIRLRAALPLFERSDNDIIVQFGLELPFENKSGSNLSMGIGLSFWD